MVDTRTDLRPAGMSVHWSAVVAGAVAAAALALVLHAFGGAIGLAVSSTAPTWRDASLALWLLSGVYLILVALLAYGLGGYVAGRLASPLKGASEAEGELRDGAHGMLVWGLATLLTVFLVAFAAPVVDRLVTPSGGEAGNAASVGGEAVFAYDLDRLFRSETPSDGTDLEYNRAEAGRILLNAAGHSGMTPEDRAHLIRLVAARAGLAEADAETRVDAIVAAARENVARGRRAGVILAFTSGVAAVLGLAVAWFAAIAGGEHRSTAPSYWYPNTARRRVSVRP